MTSSHFKITRKPTRAVHAGRLTIGAGHPIAVQSMCATRTQDIEATLGQVRLLSQHGADAIRIAIDSKRDIEALAEIRKQTDAVLVVDLQESYRLLPLVAPLVQKVRYNPGHLHHHEKNIPVREKVRQIVTAAKQHECALRIGVNFGSLDPAQSAGDRDPIEAALQSVEEHLGYMQELDFTNFVVSLKSSDPNDVIEINSRFSDRHPEIPLHLGVTEAGMLPMGEVKSRVAFENLLARGIGDTLRVSLTLPFAEKFKEIELGQAIVSDVYAGRFRSVPRFEQQGLNIISCPSCSRVENEAFIDLARSVRELSSFAQAENITIAVMGCRVNGPGETDDADLGLWCAPNHVNFKRKGELVGAFSYEEILPRFKQELEALINAKRSGAAEDSSAANAR
ncbi:MAG: flavodoxin-dependent (E)-4-hydroxy-3-methylbut-2-enyl-diphosphate synthase [Oligoflexia bacterium]|nr:flavodoxin-dependent (E)-4-hydroxy-3-methylbut-2-enyl-diphosphate synthase [Oligoflexia bacterium]